MLPIQKKIIDLLEAGYLLLDQKTGAIQLSPLGYTLIGFSTPDNNHFQDLAVFTPDQLRLLRKTTRKAKSDDPRLEKLIVDYLALWPEKVMSGQRLVKQGPAAIRKKLASFLKKFPKYTDQQILAATTKYVAKLKQVNYNYMSCSDYFIEKNGVSQLEAAIVSLQNSGSAPERKSIYERTI